MRLRQLAMHEQACSRPCSCLLGQEPCCPRLRDASGPSHIPEQGVGATSTPGVHWAPHPQAIVVAPSAVHRHLK